MRRQRVQPDELRVRRKDQSGRRGRVQAAVPHPQERPHERCGGDFQRLRPVLPNRRHGQAKRYWNTGCERDPPENRWRQGEPLLQSGERRGALCHVLELDRGENGRNVMQHAIQ